MPRGGSYADNAYNRSVGRVGMPMGSCVISKGSSGSSSSAGFGGSSSSGFSEFSSSRTPTKSYASAHSSHNDSGYTASPVAAKTTQERTYADNSYNRNIGRVGMPMGSCVVSKGSASSSRSSVTGYGDAFQSTPIKSSTKTSDYFNDSGFISSPKTPSASSTPKSSETKVYVDNAKNRKLGRVGKEYGTAVFSNKDGSVKRQVYVDSPKNRLLERVGKPRGSAPEVKTDKSADGEVKKNVPYYQPRSLFDDYEDDLTPPTILRPLSQDWTPDTPVLRPFTPERRPPSPENLVDPPVAELTYTEEKSEVPKQEALNKKPPMSKLETSLDEGLQTFDDFDPIDFKDLEIKEKIGSGGFGIVNTARWKGKGVAVKKLQVQKVSKKRLKDFKAEVAMFCTLKHANIVSFFGACIEQPNLCIVMELMDTSLFDALHVNDDIEFSEDDRISIMVQTAEGLGYLHQRKIAHCDLKTANVLLNYEEGETCIAKITDFGLSVIKANTETSQSCVDDPVVRKVGTPIYSAPEVLRGEFLSANKMRVADMYSLGIVFFEVIFEEEPFYKLNLNYHQLCKQVGEKGKLPEIPTDVAVNGQMLDLMQGCWEFDPEKRMKIDMVSQELSTLKNVFV